MKTSTYNLASAVLLALTLLQRITDVVTISEIEDLHSLLESKDYDGNIRPEAIHEKANIVFLDFLITRLTSFKETEMEFEASFVFRQRWLDYRLADRHRTHEVSLSYRMFEKLWVPDTYFSNEESAFIHDITVPNRLLRVNPEGWILYSQKVTARLGCEFHLRRYPHDSQMCSLLFESFGYSTEDIRYEWMVNHPPTKGGMIKIPEFTITNFNLSDCSATYTTGTYSCKRVDIFLSRDLSYYVTRVYLPSFLIVGLSWVSFWICHRATAARTSLGLLTVLSIITQQSDLSTRLPAVSYLKAYDLWMATCLVFVFAALVEYSIVAVVDRKWKKIEKIQKMSRLSSIHRAQEGEYAMENAGIETASAYNVDVNAMDMPTRVDHVARFLFPGLFLFFNLCYWTIFYNISDY